MLCCSSAVKDTPAIFCAASSMLDGDGLGVLRGDGERFGQERRSDAQRGQTLEEPPTVEFQSLAVHGGVSLSRRRNCRYLGAGPTRCFPQVDINVISF